jgi:hypothetical protein
MHQATINRLYEAFQRCDGAAMAACYAPTASFSDPVFPRLKGAEVGGMWQMLCSQAKDLKIEFGQVQSTGNDGSAHWEAWYTFSKTGKPVHNIIEAQFTFNDAGLILTHVDAFSFYRWSCQALGLVGRVAGWLPMIKSTVRGQANKSLERFMARAG